MTEPIFDASAALPEAIGRYQAQSLIKVSEESATYLALDPASDIQVIVKTAQTENGIAVLMNEEHILTLIHGQKDPLADSFPSLIESLDYEKDGHPCHALVRTYIPGQSLEAITESAIDKPGMTRGAALNCLISLLEKLIFLHELPEPVIHRDVKPQNVVLDALGDCHLIDMGISRLYREREDVDTRVMGTRLTAPPEQFGYAQTDERSDVYSAGVLLRYCLTGEYGEEADDALDGDVRAIVRRATAFDPAHRYQRARDMQADLLAARYGAPGPQKKRRLIRWIGAALIACALIALFALLRLRLAPSDAKAYSFQEPLIERAVLYALGRDEGPVTYGDLRGVTALHVCGRQIYGSESEIWFQGEYIWVYDDAVRAAGLWAENGGITSLEDVCHMPALRELCLHNQNISDLSPLRGLRLTRLGLSHNPVTTLLPLQDVEGLAALNVSGCPIRSAGEILALTDLVELDIGGTGIDTLAGFEELPLVQLSLYNLALRDWTEVGRLTQLKSLALNGLNWNTAYALSHLDLRQLTSLTSDAVSLHDLQILASLEELDYRRHVMGVEAMTPLHFPRLISLCVQNVSLESLECLSELHALRELILLGSEIRDYSGLDNLSDLQLIICSSEQKAALEARYPQANWTYAVSDIDA